MIAPTTPEDARYVAEHLRKDDELCLLACGADPRQEAYEMATSSPFSWIVKTNDGEPVAMFGADHGPDGNYGEAWMFSTENAHKCARDLVYGVASVIEYSRRFWPEIRTGCEPRSERAAKFLKLVGFRERDRFTENGVTFIQMAA